VTGTQVCGGKSTTALSRKLKPLQRIPPDLLLHLNYRLKYAFKSL
jgi:hypothetical protein